ncbi:hypothetical protein IQ255_14825 [Pleurocapsales cyanobacterium LEGE 10410]|nr:hypothetical protein [Pleurocapsales cyanobacterium LEGE 10410]
MRRISSKWTIKRSREIPQRGADRSHPPLVTGVAIAAFYQRQGVAVSLRGIVVLLILIIPLVAVSDRSQRQE